MEPLELLEIIEKGETSKVQFKRSIPHTKSLAQEMVAFSNSEGGLLIIGVDDQTGSLTGLSFEDIKKANEILSNTASGNIKPPILIKTDTVKVEDKLILIVEIEEGITKPYKDNDGIIFVKQGSDKRKLTSTEEIARLMQKGKFIYADEMIVAGTSFNDIELKLFSHFLKTKTGVGLEDLNIDISKALQNLNLLQDDQLTLAGLLLFSHRRHIYKPLFTVHCIKVDGTDLTGNEYEDSESPAEGTIIDVYQTALNFISRNIKKVQSGGSFNSPSVWQVPREVFEELIVNALIHRDYFIQSTIKINYFNDRIEIISPGSLPNSLTVENIKSGISISRNPVLQSLAQHILPYKGLGTGISRAIKAYPAIEFINDKDSETFKAVIRL